MFPASKNIKLWGGGTPSKQRVIEKNFFYFFIVAEIRSDETPSIFNFKKNEIMKHPTRDVMRILTFRCIILHSTLTKLPRLIIPTLSL